jgi:hypothetical protein
MTNNASNKDNNKDKGNNTKNEKRDARPRPMPSTSAKKIRKERPEDH